MHKLIFEISIITFLASCNSKTDKTQVIVATKKSNIENTASSNNTTPKVTGIGGIFFFFDNPEKAKEWYAKNLGLETNEWGSSFEFRNANRPDEINYLQWSPFNKGSECFAPS